MKEKCSTCGKLAHDFSQEEALICVPPKEVLQFGRFRIDPDYRDELFRQFSFYTSEEIVGSYLGHNPIFPSQEEWLERKEQEELDEEIENDEEF